MKNFAVLLLGFICGGLTLWFWLSPTTHTPAVNIPTENRDDPIESIGLSAQNNISVPQSSQQDKTPTSFRDLAALTGDFEQTLALYRLMEHQDVAGILRLLDDAKVNLKGGDYAAAASILYGRLAELQPDLAVSLVLQRPGTAQSNWIHAIFHAWARIDLDAALAAAENLNAPFKQTAGRAILRSRDDLATSAKLRITNTLSLQAPPLSLDDDFPTVWQQALAQSNPGLRTNNLMRVAQMWAASDPSAAMLASDAIPSHSMRIAIQSQIVPQWVKQDPESALNWVMNQSPISARANLIGSTFRALAQYDLQDARQRVQLLSGSQREQAMLGLIGALAAADPEAANQWMTTEASAQVRMQAIQQIAMGMSQKSTAEINSWLDGLPTNEKQMASGLVDSILAQLNPDQAALRIEELQDPERKRKAAERLVTSWAQHDVDRAATWIQAMPEAEQGPLYRTLIRQWGRWDPDTARQFVDQLPNSEHQDIGRVSLIRGLDSFADAQSLYQSISDETLKKQAAARIYAQFRNSHPEQVEIYRLQAGIRERR